MTLQISGKNVDIGQSLRSRIDETTKASVEKYFDGGYSGHVTISRSGKGFSAECTIHLDTGIVFEASANEGDANAAFDHANERLEKRLRRYHRRLKDHKKSASARRIDSAMAFVLEAPSEDDEISEDYAPAIVAETRSDIKALSVSGAVMELDRTDSPVVVFRNTSHGQVNVVYRRKDGNFGWIDPSLNEKVAE